VSNSSVEANCDMMSTTTLSTPTWYVEPKSINREEGYKHLLEDYGFDPSTGRAADQNANTKTGQKFDASQDLLECSARMKDGSELLDEYMDSILSSNAPNQVKSVAKKCKTIVGDVMKIAAKETHEAAKKESPIPNGDKAFARSDNKRKAEIRDENPSKKPQIKVVMMKEFIAKKKNVALPKASSKKARPHSARRAKQLPTRVPPPPAPVSDSESMGSASSSTTYSP